MQLNIDGKKVPIAACGYIKQLLDGLEVESVVEELVSDEGALLPWWASKIGYWVDVVRTDENERSIDCDWIDELCRQVEETTARMEYDRSPCGLWHSCL